MSPLHPVGAPSLPPFAGWVPAAVLGLLLPTLAACGSADAGPPVIRVDRTACARCGMLISEPAFAATYRLPDGSHRTFDDLACLLEAWRAEPRRERLPIWVRDFQGDGWLPVEEARFVRVTGLRTPMVGGVVAVAKADAGVFAERLDGRVLGGFAELVAEAPRGLP